MKLQLPAGYFTDRPPVSSEPFWYFGLNVRFRQGLPETVGLSSQILVDDPLQHARVILDGGVGDFYSDRSLILVGSGQTIWAIDLENDLLVSFNLPASGTTGRWWFTATETVIYAGRANFLGSTYAIPRATLNPVLLPNAPIGGMAGGIVNGIFIQAGTTGVAGDGPDLVVRWSARRTDPPAGGSGPAGFEDWIPSDINASGEFLLDSGSEIIGGMATTYGFIVWTDTQTYLLEPRNDLYVFSLRKIAQRGLLSPKAFCEADGRVWWWDATRTLNVFDGGAVRQIPNPMRMASVDRMVEDDVFTKTGVSANTEYGEVALHYSDSVLGMVELVFNYLEDAWYVFSLNRVALTPAQGARPAIGLDSDGYLSFYDIRERLSYDLTHPPFGPASPVPTPVATPEPFDWFIMTNHIAGASLVMESLRARNISVSYTVAQVDDPTPDTDEVSMAIRSWGSLDLADTSSVVNTHTNSLGDMVFPMRAGGKRMQMCLFGQGFKSLLRIGEIDVEAEGGGEK